MGYLFIDQFSYLHFVVGAVVFYFNISFFQWFIIHTIFEIVENTQTGIYIINNYLTFWPGGKPKADTLLNRTGDIVFGMLGWLSASIIVDYAKSKKLYYK